MPIYTNCPSCQSALSVGEHLQDKKIRCKKCSYVFTIDEALASLSKQDEAEIEGADAQLQIQQTPQFPESPVEREAEPASSPLIEQMPGDLPQIPSLRRERWRLIIGLAINGVVMFVLGGAVVLGIVLYGGPSWNGAIEQLDIDFRGSWPVPSPPVGLEVKFHFPEDRSVTLHIAAAEDDNTRDAIYGKAPMLADGGRGGIAGAQDGDRMTLLVTPVTDPQSYARKIDFGTVRRVLGRTISVVAHKVEGPPPNADAVTKAVYHLKSPNRHRRSEAAERLKMMVPGERREEVARALHGALMDNPDFFSRRDILEALEIWGTKDSVPILLKALAEGDPDRPFGHDVFTLEAFFRVLTHLKDERACEPIAHYLENFASRREAAEALKAMGPIAEKAVLKRLQHPDHAVRREAYGILRVIGTKESRAALERMPVDEKDFEFENVQEILRAIKARQK